MAVKLDESLSDMVGEVLTRAGYEVRSVRGQGWSGTKDSALWPLVQAEKVFFITADKGFGDMRAYAPGQHSGLLVLRTDTESIAAYRDLLTSVLTRVRLEELVGCTAVASARSVRVRRPGPTG